MTNEDFEKKWKTCRYCGITKEDIEKKKKETGKSQYNYVISGECLLCSNRIKDEDDFNEAAKNGSICRDDSIMCPYCGDVVEDDLGEFHNNNNFHCYECDKESKLEIEYTTHFTTIKKVNKK